MKSKFKLGLVIGIFLSVSFNAQSQSNNQNLSTNQKKKQKMDTIQSLQTNKQTIRKLYEEILNTAKLELLNQIV